MGSAKYRIEVALDEKHQNEKIQATNIKISSYYLTNNHCPFVTGTARYEEKGKQHIGKLLRKNQKLKRCLINFKLKAIYIIDQSKESIL